MSGKQRLDLPQSLYYTELKSSGQRSLFSDRASFQAFKDLLPVLHQEMGTSVLGYCLLQHKIHLVLKNGDAPIADNSRWLSKQFTDFYNEHHQRSGSVFQTHPVHTLIEPNEFLLATIKQLHYLPVIEKLVAEPSIYPWSSHSEYSQKTTLEWFDRSLLLNRVSHQKHNQRRRYCQFMAQPPSTSLDWHQGTHAKYRALATAEGLNRLQQNQPAALLQSPSLDWIAAAVCNVYGLELRDLQLWRRHRLASEVKGVIATLTLTFNAANLEESARYLQQDQELLENSIRSLSGNRAFFLHKLQLKLQQQLAQAPQDALLGEELAESLSKQAEQCEGTEPQNQ